MQWPFVKYTGCGNDFILFDNRCGKFPFSRPDIIQRLCHRQCGIGADGILLLEHSEQADCCMRILNRDGSEAEMCGNGLRCFADWLETVGFNQQTFCIEVMHRTFKASKAGSLVSIEMRDPSLVQWNIPLRFEEQFLHVHHLDTGVPHTILFVQDADAVDLARIGPYLRYHPFWQPKGTNVTIAQQNGSQTFKVRTYERGVEGETLACGTGATAAALAAARQYCLNGPLRMQTRSGEELEINFREEAQLFSAITMTGPAQYLFRGEIDLPENSRADPPFSIACNSVNSVKS